MRETWVRSLGREDPLEKEMATHSSILAWRIPWIEEPGQMQSTGSQRVGHDWVTSLIKDICIGYQYKCIHWRILSNYLRQLRKFSLKVFPPLFFPLKVCLFQKVCAQMCPTLCDPMDCSPSGSSVHGILQARVLEWVAISFSRGSSWPRDWTPVFCIAGRCFTFCVSREALMIVFNQDLRMYQLC